MSNYYISSKSPKHEKNQDSLGYWSRDGMKLIVLCDGMGGLAKGELASHTIVSTFRVWFKERFDSSCVNADIIRSQWFQLLEEVNQKIFQYGKNQGYNIGSTVVVALIVSDKEMYVCHVGDSRLYVVRSSHVDQITKDQTVLQRDLDAGRIRLEDADKHPQRHVLLQAIGTHEHFAPDFQIVEEKWDVLVLCSDGFYNRLNEEDLLETIESQSKLENVIERLRERGEMDDITAIVIS